MNNESRKIQSFTDLRTWQNGHKLVIQVYRATKKFPSDEQFGLSSQLRRALVSFTSNIAEGFSRKSKKEKIQFFSISLGSLTEIQNQLLIAKDLGYLSQEQFDDFAKETIVLHKMTNGLIKKSESRNS